MQVTTKYIQDWSKVTQPFNEITYHKPCHMYLILPTNVRNISSHWTNQGAKTPWPTQHEIWSYLFAANE